MTGSPGEPGRVLVFIPSFNDGAALPGLVQSLGALGPRFQPLLIDDGSATPVVGPALEAECLHVRLPANFGLGLCTHIAFSHALRHQYAVVVRIDADGQHDVRDIARMVALLDSGDTDLVIGARSNQERRATPDNLARRLMKQYFTTFAALLTAGALPRDVNSGLFAVNAATMAALRGTTFERFPEPEMFIVAVRAGLRVVAVDVKQRPRREGRSTLGVVAALRLFFRFTVFAVGQVFRRSALRPRPRRPE